MIKYCHELADFSVVFFVFSRTSHIARPMNVSALFPSTSTSFGYARSQRPAGVSHTAFAGTSGNLSSVFSSSVSSTSDRSSKVARISELSQSMQSRLRGPMQELGRHLEREWMFVLHLSRDKLTFLVAPALSDSCHFIVLKNI